MTALTASHLDKLTDEDLRAIALRILHDATGAINSYIEEHGLTNHPDLDPTPVHEAADWLRTVLTNPDNGYNHDTWEGHLNAVGAFLDAARDIGESTTGTGLTFPPHRNAIAVGRILGSVYHDDGTPHRPYVWVLHYVLDAFGGGFIPSRDTPAGYVIRLLHPSDDPRLPALAESYLQSGLHVNLRPAIDEATQQLARLDELTELNR